MLCRHHRKGQGLLDYLYFMILMVINNR